jgi:prepilin-type N-terminal cleavage/methylation domain-containing protein
MKTKGFTLIELMIVITIIALLVAIIAPIFKGAQTCSDSNDKYCRSNITTTPNGLKIACINGIVYFLGAELRPSTAVIDPETKQPQTCEVERL